MMLVRLVVGAEQVQFGIHQEGGPGDLGPDPLSVGTERVEALWPKTGSPVTGSGAAWTAATVIIPMSHPPGCSLIRREHRGLILGRLPVELVAPVSRPGMW